jgi:hypothetical protein
MATVALTRRGAKPAPAHSPYWWLALAGALVGVFVAIMIVLYFCLRQ